MLQKNYDAFLSYFGINHVIFVVSRIKISHFIERVYFQPEPYINE